MINLKTELSEVEFRKFNFYNFYHSIAGKLITGIGFFIWIPVLMYFMDPSLSFGRLPLTEIFVASILTIGVPLIIFYQAKKKYNSNTSIKEKIMYEFNLKSMSLQGSSFESRFSWKEIQKVVETNKWILIFTNANSCHIIPKSSNSTQSVESLRMLLVKIPELKVKLLKKQN